MTLKHRLSLPCTAHIQQAFVLLTAALCLVFAPHIYGQNAQNAQNAQSTPTLERIEITPTTQAVLKNALDTLKPKFGQPMILRFALPADFAPLKPNLVWSLAIGTTATIEQPFTDSLITRFLPASAKTVTLELVWKKPPTAERTTVERVVLAGRTMLTEQMPLQYYGRPFIEGLTERKAKQMKLRAGETAFTIRGPALMYKVPIDAETDTTLHTVRLIPSELNDVEVVELGVDLSSPLSELSIYKEGRPDPSSSFKLSPSTVQVQSGLEAGVFVSTVRLRGLPAFKDKKERMLVGSLMLKVVTRLINRRAGVAVLSPLVLPVQVGIELQ
jgi:hypothetical protein